jgi:hypothetical protein
VSGILLAIAIAIAETLIADRFGWRDLSSHVGGSPVFETMTEETSIRSRCARRMTTTRTTMRTYLPSGRRQHRVSNLSCIPTPRRPLPLQSGCRN